MLEDDISAYLLVVAALVLIQFGLLFDQVQDAPRACDTQPCQAKGPDRHKGDEAHIHRQSHERDQAANRQLMLRNHVQTVQEGECQCDAYQERWQVASLNLSIPDKKVAVASSILEKFLLLLLFLSSCLDHLDAFHCLVQDSVSRAKLSAHLLRDGAKLARVVAQGDQECSGKEQRHEQQFQVDRANKDQDYHQTRSEEHT